MSNLKVQAYSNGGLALGSATVSAYAASTFPVNPRQGSLPPAQAPAASGTTGTNGQVTLTGLSAVAYWVMVDDPLDYPYWFAVPSSWIGASDFFTVSLTMDTFQRSIK